MESTRSYQLAQRALADLKIAVYEVLSLAAEEGLTNAQVGRMLGIYGGHEGHEGHISRVVLGLLETDGTAQQDQATKRWNLRRRIEQFEALEPPATVTGH